VGFALLGYCPGTIAGAIGNGYLDAVTAGLVGIIFGSGLLATIYPGLKEGILKKGYFGNNTLPLVFRVNNWVVIIPMAIIIVAILYLIEQTGF
jgi:hypothetical protein